MTAKQNVGLSRRSIMGWLLLASIGLLARFCFFVVDASEAAIVTEFGDPLRVVETPGLNTKLPYQRVRKFSRRLFVFTPSLNEFLTLEKTAVVASSVVLWRIAEPKRYFETVFDRVGAESRLGDILFAELGAAIGRHPLTAFVSDQPGAYQAEAVVATVRQKCAEIARRDYGIEVVDVQLQRFDFPERNRLRVYARMKSERARTSMKYRSEGEEEGIKIRAAAAEEKMHILAEAFKIAERHRGEGEAEAARIYAEALERAPEFYRFLRTIEASKQFIGADTTLVLPADSTLFGLLHGADHFERASQPSDVANEAELDSRDAPDQAPTGAGHQGTNRFLNQQGGPSK